MNPFRDRAENLRTVRADGAGNIDTLLRSEDLRDGRILRMLEVNIRDTYAYSALRRIRLLNEDGSLKYIPSYFKARHPSGIWVYYRIKHIDNSNASVEFKSKILGGLPKTSTVFATTMSTAWVSSSWNVSESTEAAYEAGSNIDGS